MNTDKLRQLNDSKYFILVINEMNQKKALLL